MAGQSLWTQEAIKHPLIYGEAGGRIRKDVGYLRHYMPDLRASLESGDLIMVVDQAMTNIQFYLVDPRSKPVYLPPRKFALYESYTTGLAKLEGGKNPGRTPIHLEDLNVGLGEIALYKLYVASPGVMVDIEQPANAPIFTDGRAEPIRITYGGSGGRALTKEWGGIPEVFCFEDKVEVTVNAISTDMNEIGFDRYIMAEGYRYKLIKTSVPDPADEPRVVVTLQLGPLQ